MNTSQKSSSERMTISLGNGIKVDCGSLSIALDPKRASACDYSFVSHAHIDHVHKPGKNSKKLLASKETAKLAELRGYDLGETKDEERRVNLLDSGHILGSRALLIDDRVFYTGDISTRNRGFLKGCKGVKCETLIMETTYGRPRYVFPENDKIKLDVNIFISRCFDRGFPVILTGYPLGKAQLISYLFENWDPVYLHESVHMMNSAHIEMGINLRDYPRFENTPKFQKEKLDRCPWLLIAPMSSGRSNFVKTLKQRYGAKVAAFSGWALDPGYKYQMSLDEAFAVSDHCDFKELVELAKYCNPSTIYTVHGFAKEFADHLLSLGFEASPLESNLQERITNYA